MKRLWVRLGIAAGALALGSTGTYYGIQSVRQTGDAQEEQTQSPASPDKAQPVPDEGGGPGDLGAGQVQPAGLELPAPNTVVRANDETNSLQTFGHENGEPAQPSSHQPGTDVYAPSGATAATASLGDEGSVDGSTAPYQATFNSQAQYQPPASGQLPQYRSESGQVQQGQYQDAVVGSPGQSEFTYSDSAQTQNDAPSQYAVQDQSDPPYQYNTATQPGDSSQYQAQGDSQYQQPQQTQFQPQDQFQPQADYSPQQSLGANGGQADQYAPQTNSQFNPVREPARVSIGDAAPATGFGEPSQYDSRAGAAGTTASVADAENPAAGASQFDSNTGGYQTGAADRGQFAQQSPTEQNYQAQPGFQPQQFVSQTQPRGLPAETAFATDLVSQSPGPVKLDGAQTPSVVLEKIAPEEIQVGKPAQFELTVRNVGQAVAHNVVVTDAIPMGTQFIRSTPEAAAGADRLLTWQLGKLEPGKDVTLTVELLPETEGEIGSVAQVGFQAQASVRTRCTKPMLTVDYSAPKRVLAGQEAVFTITIANPGSGAATGVVLEADIPDQMSHEAGKALEKGVGTLAPGDELSYELALRAETAGLVASKIRVIGDGNLVATVAAELEVVAPQLQAGIGGPRVRFLERQVTYDVTIVNPGTAPARNVDLVTYLPKGLRFVSADNKGKYVEQDHAVAWNLEELPEQTTGKVQLTALPVEIGEQQLLVQAKTGSGLNAEFKHATQVQGIVELAFTLADLQDPIEVGSETTYEIRVVNQGSEVATNVVLAAALPPQLKPVTAEGATRGAVQGQRIQMEPLARLAPQADAVYRIKVKGQQAGDHLIDVQLTSDSVRTPVTKQEMTKVYADR